MSFLGPLSAVPIPAVFLLLITSGILFFQFFYLGKKRELKTPEVKLPKLEDLKLPPPAFRQAGLPGFSPEPAKPVPPPLPSQSLPTTQNLDTQVKAPLPVKTLITLFLLLLTFIAIFLTVYLTKQNLE